MSDTVQGAAGSAVGRRVLVVDDEASIRAVFLQLIRFGLPNCHVDMAVNGAEAVEMFRQGHHRVVIMDLKMPVMDGEEAFRTLQALCDEEKRRMPAVIFCTGFAPPVRIESIVRANPEHCLLRKPVTNERLLDAIRSRLEG